MSDSRLYTLAEVRKKTWLKERCLRAVKTAMGKHGARFLDPVEVKAWVLAHPDFRVDQVKGSVWHQPPAANPQPGDAGINGLSEPRHDSPNGEQLLQEGLRGCTC